LQLLRPDSVEAAAAALGNGSVALAGGTEVVPLLRSRILAADTLVELIQQRTNPNVEDQHPERIATGPVYQYLLQLLRASDLRSCPNIIAPLMDVCEWLVSASGPVPPPDDPGAARAIT
jgi:CO/xanthine dehydrogenase FAD-binding subunit